MRSEECGDFRVEAEAAGPAGRTVIVKIFALEPGGTPERETPPLSTRAYAPALESMVDPEDLMTGAIELARRAIEVVNDAKSGKPVRLRVPFLAEDRRERLTEMIHVLEGYPLEGLRVTILLNPADMEGQSAPRPRLDLFGVRAANEVPAGEFHLLLKP